MAEVTHPSHPLTPPLTEDERLDWLRLLRSHRVGPVTFRRLMSEHGSARAALEALPAVAERAGLGRYRPRRRDEAQEEMRLAEAARAQMICLGDPAYPALLAEIEDAPPMLWAIGDLTLLRRATVGIVGARNASSLGLRMAQLLARDLSEAGRVVVSGLARGVDARAHDGALNGGAGTIAVVAGGVDVIYPEENRALTHRIAHHGLILSEQPMGLPPQARHFPKRNRIISGLAPGVVVIEAALRSGSLITARDALDQGREVMAVPGHPLDKRAGGCNALLRDGARLVRSVADVAEVLGPIDREVVAELVREQARRDGTDQLPDAVTPVVAKPAPRPEVLAEQVLALLSAVPLEERRLLDDLAIERRALAPVLTRLELAGQIERLPGNQLARTA